MAEAEKVSLSCERCDASRMVKPTSAGHPRPPRGWRRIGGNVLCAECFKSGYITRAITLPVSAKTEEWSGFKEAVSVSWRATTQLANWAAQQLSMRDIIRDRDLDKLPPMPKIYLYGLARDNYPRWSSLPASVSNATLNDVEARWRSSRYRVLWLCEERPLRYLYPQPIHVRDWKAEMLEGHPCVSLRLGDRRYRVMLRRDKGFRRQVAAFNQIVDGSAEANELVVYRKRSNSADHRPGVVGRDNSGGSKASYSIMVKLVAHFPLAARAASSGTLMVKSTAESMIEAIDQKGQRIWWYHADNVRRALCAHASHLERLQRFADDRKHERRRPKHRGKPYKDMVSEAARKNSRRMSSFVEQISASVVEFSKRRRYATLSFDSSERSMARSFPWHLLSSRISERCKAAGIEFVDASGPVANNGLGSLELEEDQC